MACGIWTRMMNKKTILMMVLLGLFAILVSGLTSAAVTVCCQKTISGLSCQDVPASECAPDSPQAPTACRTASFCRPGTCFDSNEGTCLINTPQIVCNANGGIWSEKPVSQCALGCCVMGDQAAFVTLTRCKKLSASLGLESNFKKDITNEAQCILSVQNLQKGACVYESDLQRLCKFTTRGDCANVMGLGNASSTKGEFHVGKLCSAEELGTRCGPTSKTTCVPGKEEVYFVDTCGNPANIYDSSKLTDKDYWANVKDKLSSCDSTLGNANSPSCGNCNYLLGSICRDSSKAGGTKPYYGDNICADLNCKKTANGKSYKHGESWCVNDDAGKTGTSNNAVGSGFYRHICINGEEILEACADFRQHECIEGSITTSTGTFAQAACRVNRWQDCTAQSTEKKCEDSDKRDCTWFDGGEFRLIAGAEGSCVPKNSPGLKFWEGTEATDICAKATKECEAKMEEDISGNQVWSGECVDNRGKVDNGWLLNMQKNCMAIGDCGPKINWLGDSGYGDKYGRVGYELNTHMG